VATITICKIIGVTILVPDKVSGPNTGPLFLSAIKIVNGTLIFLTNASEIFRKSIFVN
jgi:hypothetical protein